MEDYPTPEELADKAGLAIARRELVPERPKKEARALTLAEWVDRTDINDDFDYLMGQWLHRESAIMLFGKSGKGKSFFVSDLAIAVACGVDFGEWEGTGTVCNVLIVDGEMSPTQIRKRLRARGLSSEALRRVRLISALDGDEQFPPINTEAGRQCILQLVIEHRIDLIILDNRQALTTGNLNEQENWLASLPLVRELKRLKVAQIWLHHANASNELFGDKSVSWQLTDVMHLTEARHRLTNLSFTVDFETKARDRSSENEASFTKRKFSLVDGKWEVEVFDKNVGGAEKDERGTAATISNAKLTPSGRIYLDALRDVIVSDKMVRREGQNCATQSDWKAELVTRGILEPGRTSKRRADFSRYRRELLEKQMIVIRGDVAWLWRGES